MLSDLAPTTAVPAHSAPLLGRLMNGYRVVDVLGTGGMSVVYRGELPEGSSGEPSEVAIKVLQLASPPQQATLTRFFARFRREAQVAMSLHHPHIVPMLGSGKIDGQPYVVFPMLAGGTLAAHLATHHEPLELAEVGRYAEQVAAALDYAHAHGIVHRDVKSSNILLDEHGDAYLADFGIARLFEGGVDALEQPDGTDVTTVTTTGEIIGTPSYMAPEQFHGQPVGPAADVYALGIVLYQLTTGRLPFTGETPIAVGLRHLHEAPLSPRLLRSDLPVPAAAAIIRALAKRPEQRFSRAGDLAHAFVGGLQGRWVGQNFEQSVFYPGATIEAHAVPHAQPLTATTATRRIHPVGWPHLNRLNRASGGSPAWGSRRVAGISGALLLLGALVLAAHGLNPGGGVDKRTVTSTATPTHAHAVATRFRFDGARVFALDATGHSVWSTSVDTQVTRLAVFNGHVYASTTSGATYVLQATTGQILALQPTATPKGKHGKGDNGGNGGDGNGD